MCLAVFLLDTDPRYRLIVAANRDEFHARPAVAAAWWRAANGVELLGGRDLEAGGAWLGVDARGRWAFVTNVREPGRHDPDAPSRGRIVPALLAASTGPASAMGRVLENDAACNGFNAVAGDRTGAAYGSNRRTGVITIAAGVHGVSNATLDTPWPKLVRARDRLTRFASAGVDDPVALWALLGDRTIAADALLPATGVPLEQERLLSAAFIVSPRYGTRASTLLTIDRKGDAWFAERSYDAQGLLTGEIEFRFRVTAPAYTA